MLKPIKRLQENPASSVQGADRAPLSIQAPMTA
jgi:hypothetical protein